MDKLEFLGNMGDQERGIVLLCMRVKVHHLKGQRFGLLIEVGRLMERASLLGFVIRGGGGNMAMVAYAIAASATAGHGENGRKGSNVN